MTIDMLINEAEKLSKESYIYTKANKGDVVFGYWFNDDQLPLRFATKFNNDLYFIMPLNPNYVYFDYKEIIQLDYKVDLRKSTKLTKLKIKSYPSLDYLFYFGGDEIQQWLKEKNWKKDWGYNNNFKDSVANEYNKWWQKVYPIYSEKDLYAFEGGWPMTWPEDDSPLMFDSKNELIFCTLKNPEPWLEIYRIDGEYKGFWRNT